MKPRRACVYTLAMLAVTAAATADTGGLRIEEPGMHWYDAGYEVMIPSIRLPTTHARDNLIRIWLKLPDDGYLRVTGLPAQGRMTLEFPPGTRVDRVESRAYRAPDGMSGVAVLDVRGTSIDADGQIFHVYRPESGEAAAPLTGWSWRRDDLQARNRATRALVAHAAGTRRPVDRVPESGEGLRMLAELNRCESCHLSNLPSREQRRVDPPVHRATDAMGFFVPLAVLNDSGMLSQARPTDLNADDPFVEVRCGGMNGRRAALGGNGWYDCPADEPAFGVRDVRAGLGAGDPYTRQLCRSRRYLYEHMHPGDREYFRDSFAACGIFADTAAPPPPGRREESVR